MGHFSIRISKSLALFAVVPTVFSGSFNGSAPIVRELTFAADSCSAADVQTALDNAPDGSTVTIPAGACDWGDDEVFRDAGVTVVGAGEGATIIRRTAAVSGDDIGDALALLRFDCSNGETVEVSGFTMIGNDDQQTPYQRQSDFDEGLVLEGGCVDFKIHDVTLDKFSYAGLAVLGIGARGVVYQSHFDSDFKCSNADRNCLGYGVMVLGDAHETRPEPELGSENAVFVEDSTFYDDRHAIASNYGSQYVFRHNTVIMTKRTRNYGAVDAHGHSEDYDLPGSASWEIYENTFDTNHPSVIGAPIVTRGGDGVVWGNTMTNMSHVMFLTNENCPATGAYPLPDQTTSAYIWDNSWEDPWGSGAAAVEVPEPCQKWIKEGRDYFQSPMPDYTPYPYPHPLR